MFDRSVRASSPEILGGHGWTTTLRLGYFMPFKWAYISEMVHTGEDLCSTSLSALMTGGRHGNSRSFVCGLNFGDRRCR
jgi:hypothetical protein